MADEAAVAAVMRQYCCHKCGNDVSRHDDIVSKGFKAGKRRRAFLFSHVWNVAEGPEEERRLNTGVHTVVDVYCCDCKEVLGWKYIRAPVERLKYKEGKTVLEKFKISRQNW